MANPVYFHQKPCYQHKEKPAKKAEKRFHQHISSSNNHKLSHVSPALENRVSPNVTMTALLLSVLLLSSPVLIKANSANYDAHPNYDPPESTSVSIEPSYDPPGGSISVSTDNEAVSVAAYSDGSAGFAASNSETTVYGGVGSDGSFYGGVEQRF